MLVASVVLLGIAMTNEANDRTPFGVPTPTGLTRAASVVPDCITADDPGTLIETTVLSRDLRHPAARCGRM